MRCKVVFISLLSVFGCQTTPNKLDIVGVWESNDGATLELNSDGSFKGKYLPTKNFSYPLQRDYGERFSGIGKWKFNSKISQQIDLDFDSMRFKSISKGSYYGLRIYTENAKSTNGKLNWYLYLWEDPTEITGEQYLFEKVPQ